MYLFIPLLEENGKASDNAYIHKGKLKGNRTLVENLAKSVKLNYNFIFRVTEVGTEFVLFKISVI